MWSWKSFLLFSSFIQCLTFIGAWEPVCKAVPGTPSWPSLDKWKALNSSIDGRLLQPSPPGAVCHSDQPTYNADACTIVTQGWTNIDFEATIPNSIAWDNWNNDSCLPYPGTPCSGEGYPVYVINATSKEDVKAGVDFARKNNVRLIVKGSGHDYLGRSSAPYSLSIWTWYLTGVSISDGFRPQGCKFTIDTPAVTLGSGTDMGELNLATSLQNLTVLGAGEESVVYSGYVTGGGHSGLAPSFGLAADVVLEMELVTPGGDILTVNECQNRDFFWAMRGGGGSTFGVLTSITIQAFPSVPLLVYNFQWGTAPDSEQFWNALTYWFSEYPTLSAQNIAGYNDYAVNTTLDGVTYYGGVQGEFLLPVLSPANTTESLSAAIGAMLDNITATYPGQFVTENGVQTYASYYDWWLPANGPKPAGFDFMVGSRLLDKTALTGDLSALQAALKVFSEAGGGNPILVGGGKVNSGVPRGGSNSVNPAWRKTILHCTTGAEWPPLDPAAKAEQLNLLTNTWVEALRKLAPDTGAYVNEADANEPNFQQAFWGDNYPRLLDIKRRYDPDDVLWCTPCVGNERWEEVGNLLCKV